MEEKICEAEKPGKYTKSRKMQFLTAGQIMFPLAKINDAQASQN